MPKKAKIKYTHVRVWSTTKTLIDKSKRILNKGKKHVQLKDKWNDCKLINSAVKQFVRQNKKTRSAKTICNFLNNKDSLDSLNTQELKI